MSCKCFETKDCTIAYDIHTLPSFPRSPRGLTFFCLPLKITHNSANPEDFHKILVYHWEICENYASLNSSCAQAPPPPPQQADPRALVFFLPWMANSWGWGLSSWAVKFPGWGRKKRTNALSSINTATFFIDCTVEKCHFNVLKISMCEFLFQVTSSFVIMPGL